MFQTNETAFLTQYVDHWELTTRSTRFSELEAAQQPCTGAVAQESIFIIILQHYFNL